MKYFQTDDSGYLVGEFDADRSPAEPDIYDEKGVLIAAGAWLIPRGGVQAAPPAVGVEQAARWNGAAWELVPDLRGRVYWLADHSRHEITERGVSLPAGALAVDPPKSPAELAAVDSEAAKRELAALDLASIRDLREYIAAKADAPQSLKNREAAAIAARARVRA